MSLSIREQQINYELVKGYQVKEIADRLCLSPYTVDTHIKNIKKKTGAKNIADLVRNFILENPKKFFIWFSLVTLQLIMAYNNPDAELRKTNTTSRVIRVKTARKKIS